jgi:hypothetical protein
VSECTGNSGRSLDPAKITPAAIALAAQLIHGFTGKIVHTIAWNADPISAPDETKQSSSRL